MMLYEDRIATALFPENAAAHGHILVRPMRAAKRLSDLSEEESSHLFLVASYAAAILFQGLQAQGTNIIANEDGERLTLHVIARSEGDGIDFSWKPQKLDEATMQEAKERIADKAFPIGKSDKESDEKREPDPGKGSEREDEGDGPETPDERSKEPEVAAAEEEENYLIKQLIRIP